MHWLPENEEEYRFLQSQITQYIYTLLHYTFDSKSLPDLVQSKSNMQQFSLCFKTLSHLGGRKAFQPPDMAGGKREFYCSHSESFKSYFCFFRFHAQALQPTQLNWLLS